MCAFIVDVLACERYDMPAALTCPVALWPQTVQHSQRNRGGTAYFCKE